MKYDIQIILFVVSLFINSSSVAQKQVDFSSEWAHSIEQYSGGVDALEELKGQDLSGFWLSGTQSQNGVYGDDFWRIEFYISSIEQDKADHLTYRVKGKDRHKNVVTPFEGTIRITKAQRYSTPHEMNDSVYPFHIIAVYEFTEDSTSKYSGVFNGTLRTDLIYRPSQPNKLLFDEEGDDGYMNNTFVGVWTSKNRKKKKCIWGLERLPFTEDWDEGAGEIYVNKKYVKNGWEGYMKHNELTEKNGVIIQKDMWWK